MTDENQGDLEPQDEELEDDQDNIQDSSEETPEEESDDVPEGELSDREKQFLARAKKAEKKVKELKAQPEDKPEPKKPKSTDEGPKEVPLTREEVKLYAQGLDDDRINMLRKLQAISDEDITLSQAMEDPIYKSFDKERKQEERSKKAQLGGSGRGGTSTAEKPVSEMTRKEHMKLAKEKAGQ